MKNIMVVIYNSLIRIPIIKGLSGGGDNIVEITDGSSALIKLQGTKMDCVILDLNLPAFVNGIDLLKKLKINYPDVPIIIINSNLDEKILAMLEKIGIKHILNTPVNIEYLSNKINSL